ncbi:MAG: SufD family Fe-S cluster assembly protein, partial [Myxococcota bacterium]
MSAARHSFGEALQARNDRAGWFSALRQEAFARFEAAGFPTTKDEEWKYTSLGPIAEVAFAVPDMGRFADVGVPKVERVAPASLGARLVFVDGWFAPHLSSVETLPVGATVRALSTAPQGLVGRHLSQVAGFERPFCALNAALFEDGAVLHLAKGTVVERPVHFVYLSTAFERPTAAHPRNLVIAEENSQATVVEVYEGEGAYLTNAVTEVAVGEGAHVRHVKLQNESARGFHLGALYVR